MCLLTTQLKSMAALMNIGLALLVLSSGGMALLTTSMIKNVWLIERNTTSPEQLIFSGLSVSPVTLLIENLPSNNKQVVFYCRANARMCAEMITITCVDPHECKTPPGTHVSGYNPGSSSSSQNTSAIIWGPRGSGAASECN